jgi:ADP-ribose pyrophosphatase
MRRIAAVERGLVRSEYVYRGRVVTLRIDRVRTPSGERVREIVEHRGAVAIVPRTSDGRLLMVRQFRPAVGETLTEVPAGTLEPGEEPAAAAARELEEEVGYRAGSLRPLFSQFLAPGYSSEILHVFVADNLQPSTAQPDEDEEIEVVSIPHGEVEGMILDGRIKDAKSIAALLVALRFG